MVEVLVVIVVVAALGSAGYMAVSSTQQAARETKLESDVASINSAVQVYLANGGNLNGTATAEDVLAKLKTRADETSSSKTVGLTGSFVDARTEPVLQSSSEAGSGQLRAVWSPAAGAFILTNEGGGGVKEFRLNDTLAGEAPDTEQRDRTKDAATETSWVWDYNDRTNSVVQQGVTPGAAEGESTNGGTAAYTQKLQTPVIDPPSGEYALQSFSNPDGSRPGGLITASNPAGSSQIYYSMGSSFHLYSGGNFSVMPGVAIRAVAFTLDPTKYSNSDTAESTLTVGRVTPAVSVVAPQTSLTYAEAGGAMVGATLLSPSPVTLVLTNANDIPNFYESSSQFKIYYTTDGSEPSSASGVEVPFAGSFVSPSITIPAPAGWGGASSYTIKAGGSVLNADAFTSVQGDSETINITKTDLPTPEISPPNGTLFIAGMTVTLSLPDGASYPVGTRIYYTQDGTDPGNVNGSPSASATLYSAPFGAAVGANGTQGITARAYGPTGVVQWFNPSASVAVNYPAITTPDGALVGSATLNGTFVGSLIYASPVSGAMQNLAFNSGAQILKGNLYLPGQPTIRKSSGVVWSLANDAQFATTILGWEFDDEGERTVQTTPRVLDEGGSILPNNYSVTFNSNAMVEGKVIRRHDSPGFPTIPNPPPKDSNGSTSLNSPPLGPISASQYSTVTINTSAVGNVSLLPGNYGNLTANNGTAFVLGNAANPDEVQVYSFQTLNLNSSSDLKIVGKVIITVTGNINLNTGSVVGDVNHPEWLQLQFTTGGLTANSGSSVYGKMVAPKGSVTFNAGSIFQGSVTAQTLTINSNSVVFVLPPVIEN